MCSKTKALMRGKVEVAVVQNRQGYQGLWYIYRKEYGRPKEMDVKILEKVRTYKHSNVQLYWSVALLLD